MRCYDYLDSDVKKTVIKLRNYYTRKIAIIYERSSPKNQKKNCSKTFGKNCTGHSNFSVSWTFFNKQNCKQKTQKKLLMTILD